GARVLGREHVELIRGSKRQRIFAEVMYARRTLDGAAAVIRIERHVGKREHTWSLPAQVNEVSSDAAHSHQHRHGRADLESQVERREDVPLSLVIDWRERVGALRYRRGESFRMKHDPPLALIGLSERAPAYFIFP